MKTSRSGWTDDLWPAGEGRKQRSCLGGFDVSFVEYLKVGCGSEKLTVREQRISGVNNLPGMSGQRL